MIARPLLRAPVRCDLRQDARVISQRLHRALAVCLALTGCDAPASPDPPPSKPTSAPSPTPTPTPPPETEAPKPGPAPVETQLPPPKVAPELEKIVAGSINDLTIGLQRKLARQPGNVFVSGVGVALGLTMLHAGSSGATAKELAKVLHLEQPTPAVYAGLAGLVFRWTRPDDHVALAVATRLFGEQKLGFTPAYLDLTRTVFASPLTGLDMLDDPAGARDRINGWAREQSGDRMDELVPVGAIASMTGVVVASVAQFDGDWLEPFDPALTTTQPFSGGEVRREVQMMRSVQRLRVAFGKAGKLRVLELPYKGGKYSMIIVLPSTRGGLADIEKSFDAEKLQGWIDSAKVSPIDLRLPKLKLDSNLELAPAILKLGAARVFNKKKAELGAMAGEPLGLASVRHRAQISVEERRAASTDKSAIVVSVGGAPADPVPFIVDRPFLFYIRDVRTGALLYYGRVTDPGSI